MFHPCYFIISGISEIAPPYIVANTSHKFIWSPNHPNLYPNNHVQVRNAIFLETKANISIVGVGTATPKGATIGVDISIL